MSIKQVSSFALAGPRFPKVRDFVEKSRKFQTKIYPVVLQTSLGYAGVSKKKSRSKYADDRSSFGSRRRQWCDATLLPILSATTTATMAEEADTNDNAAMESITQNIAEVRTCAAINGFGEPRRSATLVIANARHIARQLCPQG